MKLSPAETEAIHEAVRTAMEASKPIGYDLGHALLLFLLWMIPIALICAGLIAIILVSRNVGLAAGCRTIGAWWWSVGYGIDAFKAEQKLHFTKCMADSQGIEVTR